MTPFLLWTMCLATSRVHSIAPVKLTPRIRFQHSNSDFGYRLPLNDSGIADEYIDTAQLTNRIFNKFDHLVFNRNIDFPNKNLSAQVQSPTLGLTHPHSSILISQ